MDTTEKNRVVKSKDAFDKKEVIIMSKKRSLKMLLVIIMAVATISEGLTLTWGNEFSDGEEIISDAGEETVPVSEELFSSGVSEENSVEADVPVATASYNNNWRCWNQGQSDYADMRNYGCWVTAQAKLLYETGVDRSASFNPDTYMVWQKANGYLNSGFYQTNGGAAPVAYAKQKGKNLEYLGNWTSDAGQLWFNINAGYYTIVAVPGHYVYLDNEKSKATGQLYCDDSSSTVLFNSPQPLSRYNSWKSCYVYKSNGNGTNGGNNSIVNISWSEWVEGISKNNAKIYGKIDVGQRVQFTAAGVNIWNAAGNLIHQSTEGTGVNYNYMQISYNLQSELGVTLSPGQSYTYQMFADFGGQRYYGNKKTFTTLPDTTNSNNTKVVTPNPTLKSTRKGQIQLSWKKYNASDKYQIQYCRNRFFIGTGKKNTAANDYTLVRLKSKNRYYVRVRSYRKIGNKNVYSAWSKVKSIKVK